MTMSAIHTTPEKALALLKCPAPGATAWALVQPLKGDGWKPGLFVAHLLEDDVEVVLLKGDEHG